jgi:hypothetical protein
MTRNETLSRASGRGRDPARQHREGEGGPCGTTLTPTLSRQRERER